MAKVEFHSGFFFFLLYVFLSWSHNSRQKHVETTVWLHNTVKLLPCVWSWRSEWNRVCQRTEKRRFGEEDSLVLLIPDVLCSLFAHR